jgi:hypothetical protein
MANGKIKIHRDGTWTPKPATINPGDYVTFDVEYPDGKNLCNIKFEITFENQATATQATAAQATAAQGGTQVTPMSAVGTIKVGS